MHLDPLLTDTSEHRSIWQQIVILTRPAKALVLLKVLMGPGGQTVQK
jgi:hypothetical protein